MIPDCLIFNEQRVSKAFQFVYSSAHKLKLRKTILISMELMVRCMYLYPANEHNQLQVKLSCDFLPDFKMILYTYIYQTNVEDLFLLAIKLEVFSSSNDSDDEIGGKWLGHVPMIRHQIQHINNICIIANTNILERKYRL